MIIKLPEKIVSTKDGSKELIYILDQIHSAKNGDTVVLDFSNLEWIDANLLAALGAVFEENLQRVKLRYIKGSLNSKIQTLLSKNGFGIKYFELEKVEDVYDTIIEYKMSKGKEIKKFAEYFLKQVLMREKMPRMSNGLKEKILENVLEIFGNAPMHGGGTMVYSCGQIFPTKNAMKFTIANTGHTIKENVIDYYIHERGEDPPSSTIEWATKENNSTKKIVNGKSGGLGLYFLKQFIGINGGTITICSSDEVWHFSENKESTTNLDKIFAGTIVTIEININDSRSYILDNEVNNEFSDF